jgi:predicted nucleic acid-binding protein
MIVVDASVVANAVGDDEDAGRRARALLRRHDALAAPDLVDVETAAVLRRCWLAGDLTDRRFSDALDDLGDLPVTRFPTLPLLGRVFELRRNVTAYDVFYVTLAERLGVPLATADRRLAGASGPGCSFEVVDAAT